ncbi:MAG: adenylate/guanylate cyclase domain-containing protein [Alsobacter sp.]
MTTILVVDDEPDLEVLILQKFRRRIAAGELSFVFARDGVEALERVNTTPGLDLVLSDINMPRMDGLELLARLQEEPEPPATIIVSAYGDMSNIRTAMNRGAFDFLTKPIDFADVEVTIGKTLRHIGAFREARARWLEAEKSQAALARYFSPNLAAELVSSGAGTDLRSARRELTALFTDIAGFTALVETLEPDLLADLLNRYFRRMTDIVFAHEGTVAKLMGDALHVLFGAPLGQDDHAARAVACALALDAAAEAFRADAVAQGIVLGVTRIGVHSGPALVGNFGGGRFFDYTAYGDTINTAARLEAANKTIGTRVCVSADTAARVPGFRGRPIGDLALRGRAAPLRAFEPLQERDEEPAAYASAFSKLEANDPAALPAFAALVGVRSDDPLASLHLRRLLDGRTGTRLDA